VRPLKVALFSPLLIDAQMAHAAWLVTFCCCCCCADGKYACTYCGAQVAMTQAQRIAQAQQQPHGSSTDTAAAAAAGGSSTAAAAADDATAKAIAFKDRLVDYDRHSQKRTTVIDDQSDYFEIDTNAWLSEGVRPGCTKCLLAPRAAPALLTQPAAAALSPSACLGCSYLQTKIGLLAQLGRPWLLARGWGACAFVAGA
jgi:hypothetical protein